MSMFGYCCSNLAIAAFSDSAWFVRATSVTVVTSVRCPVAPEAKIVASASSAETDEMSVRTCICEPPPDLGRVTPLARPSCSPHKQGSLVASTRLCQPAHHALGVSVDQMPATSRALGDDRAALRLKACPAA